MKILAVIVTYNGMPWIGRCLGSLEESRLRPEILVVDNASADGTPDWIKDNHPSVRLVRNTSNAGFAAANNIGLEIALKEGFDAVYLMNQDAWVEDGTLSALAIACERHPEFAVLSPLQMTPGYGGYDRLFEKNVLSQIPDMREGDPCPMEVTRVMAAHWLIPVSALRKVGLFAPVFPFYGEDDNWCDRARFHGLKAGVVLSAKAVHDRGERSEEKERVIYRNYYMGSLRRLCDINRPLWERWLYVLAFTFVKAFKYKSFHVFSRLWSIWGLRSEILRTREETARESAFIKSH